VPPIMPSVFFGHGSPMNALQTNDITQIWSGLAQRLPRPRAILCISAQWCTRGTAVTAMRAPRTLHDFGGFPRALFQVQYPAPGDTELANTICELLAPRTVNLDHSWGLDHGAWAVLIKMYPNADIPVVQLSMNVMLSAREHFEIGRALAPLREQGVLIMGAGNVVHNLGLMSAYSAVEPYAWAARFNDYVRQAVLDDAPERLIEYEALGDDAQLSVPSPDHYWPLLYVMGTRRPHDVVKFELDFIEHGSLSMLTVLLDRPRTNGRHPTHE